MILHLVSDHGRSQRAILPWLAIPSVAPANTHAHIWLNAIAVPQIQFLPLLKYKKDDLPHDSTSDDLLHNSIIDLAPGVDEISNNHIENNKIK